MITSELQGKISYTKASNSPPKQSTAEKMSYVDRVTGALAVQQAFKAFSLPRSRSSVQHCYYTSTVGYSPGIVPRSCFIEVIWDNVLMLYYVVSSIGKNISLPVKSK